MGPLDRVNTSGVRVDVKLGHAQSPVPSPTSCLYWSNTLDPALKGPKGRITPDHAIIKKRYKTLMSYHKRLHKLVAKIFEYLRTPMNALNF